MRPAADLALRAQNWFWYYRVRQISGQSNDLLDARCFGKGGRKRHFERIQHSASSPDEIPLFGGLTLVAVVDRWDSLNDSTPGPFAPATEAFRSRLWEFLIRRDLDPSEYTNFIQDYVARQGWHRFPAGDFALVRRCLGELEPAIEQEVSTAYSAMLHKLANQATPDSLAVLIALFREAMHGVLLDQATAIKTAVRVTTHWMCNKYQMPALVTRLLCRLVSDRVLANFWATEDDWRRQSTTPRTTSKSSRDRIKELNAWVDWYCRDSRKHNAIYGVFPAVPPSSRLAWLSKNRDDLNFLFAEISAHRQQENNLDDYESPLAQQLVEEARQAADELESNLCPPADAPARFYNTYPDWVIGNLPRAY